MDASQTVPLLQVSDSIDDTIADIIEYLPTVVAGLVILLVGYIVGRLLGDIVTRIVRQIGIRRYTEGTPVEEVGGGDGVAYGLGKIVTYYVYFVAILAAADVLGITQLTELLSDLGVALPMIFGALIVLILGFIAGRIIGDIVADVVGGFGIEPYLQETPLEQISDTEGEFGRVVGLLVTYYIYLLTLLAVADILEIAALSTLLTSFAGYLPALVGGLLVLLVGIWLAERVGDLVNEMDERRIAGLASVVIKVLIYYLTITIALSTIGFDVTVLTSLFVAFTVAFFGALGLALAIGAGIAVGFGGQDYVAENIDSWVSSIHGTVSEEESTDTDTE